MSKSILQQRVVLCGPVSTRYRLGIDSVSSRCGQLVVWSVLFALNLELEAKLIKLIKGLIPAAGGASGSDQAKPQAEWESNQQQANRS